ncbi:hypothetical protein HDK77DRAFT_425937 [Phyllosticta capitalensis]|uniref:Uncharacterized protein n=1 Tax=Phyllosticta capitalensis TaxID=121624 RepID=A0ABR1Z376_9PEZI
MTYHNCTIVNQSIDQSTNRSGSSVQGPHTGSGQQQSIGQPRPPHSTCSRNFELVERAYNEHSRQLDTLQEKGRRHSQTFREAEDAVRNANRQIEELQNQNRGFERTLGEAEVAFLGHDRRIDELQRETQHRCSQADRTLSAQSRDVENLQREHATLNRRVGDLERQRRNADMLEREQNRKFDRLQARWLDLVHRIEALELQRGSSRTVGAPPPYSE